MHHNVELQIYINNLHRQTYSKYGFVIRTEVKVEFSYYRPCIITILFV